MKIILIIIVTFGSVSKIEAKPSIQSIELITHLEIEKQYNKIVKKADEYYDKREYEKALELYKRAQLLKKNDKHVIKRIRKIERKLR